MIIIKQYLLISTPHYEDPCGGSRNKKVDVSAVEWLTNLDEEGRDMHQKVKHNLRYQMDVHKRTRLFFFPFRV